VVLALIPQHAQKVAPPRTLTVPYPLGRPLGVPGDAQFQHRVLSAALDLLGRSGAPVFEEYELDAPGDVPTEEAWACPVSFGSGNGETTLAARVLNEMNLLRPWYDRHLQEGSTSVGVSGLDLDDAVRFVAGFLDDEPESIDVDQSRSQADLLKYAVEDIKAFYNEAAASQPGTASVKDMEDWYWGETSAGRLVRAVKLATAEHEDNAVKIVSSFLLVPNSQTYRDTA
jgi:hypothetical protein